MASSSTTTSPCAACKFLRRKCTAECVFAPYFPPDQPQKFINVHKIFGASNITKLLNELAPHQREDAVNSLAYEAEARVKDPVYGCVGAISLLQQKIAQLQAELAVARSDLARFATAGIVPGPVPPALGIGMGLTPRDQFFSNPQQISMLHQQQQQAEPLTREHLIQDYGSSRPSSSAGVAPYDSFSHAQLGLAIQAEHHLHHHQLQHQPHPSYQQPPPGSRSQLSGGQDASAASSLLHFKAEPP